MYNNNTYIYIFHAPIFLIRLAPHSVMWKRLCCLQQIPIIFLLISAKLQRKMPWMHFCCCWVQTFNFKKILIASQHLWWFAWFKKSNLKCYYLFLMYLPAFIMLFYVAWWYVWSDIYEIIDIILNTRCSEQSEFCSVNPKTSIFIVFTCMDIERYADLSYALLFSWDRSQVGIDQYFSVLTIVWLWITKDLHGLPSGIYESVYIIAIFGSNLLLLKY